MSEPNSKREEEYLIQIALNQSLQYNQRPCEPGLEPGYYHERATSFAAKIQPTDAEEDVSGLGMLLEAANIVEKK